MHFLDSSQPDVPECFEIPRFRCLPKPLQQRTVSWYFWILFCGLWGGVRKGSHVWKCRFKRIQLHRLEKVGLKAFWECLENLRFGCLPKPLQKRMVRWSFWQLFCVLWGRVHKGSFLCSVRLGYEKAPRDQMYQKVDLNAFSGEYALAQQRPPKWPRIWASSIPQDAFETTIDIKSSPTALF